MSSMSLLNRNMYVVLYCNMYVAVRNSDLLYTPQGHKAYFYVSVSIQFQFCFKTNRQIAVSEQIR